MDFCSSESEFSCKRCSQDNTGAPKIQIIEFIEHADCFHHVAVS